MTDTSLTEEETDGIIDTALAVTDAVEPEITVEENEKIISEIKLNTIAQGNYSLTSSQEEAIASIELILQRNWL